MHHVPYFILLWPCTVSFEQSDFAGQSKTKLKLKLKSWITRITYKYSRLVGIVEMKNSLGIPIYFHAYNIICIYLLVMYTRHAIFSFIHYFARIHNSVMSLWLVYINTGTIRSIGTLRSITIITLTSIGVSTDRAYHAHLRNLTNHLGMCINIISIIVFRFLLNVNNFSFYFYLFLLLIIYFSMQSNDVFFLQNLGVKFLISTWFHIL